MTCDGDGVVMGVATRSSWDDLDYLICSKTNLEGLQLDATDGAGFNNDKWCKVHFNDRVSVVSYCGVYFLVQIM